MNNTHDSISYDKTIREAALKMEKKDLELQREQQKIDSEQNQSGDKLKIFGDRLKRILRFAQDNQVSTSDLDQQLEKVDKEIQQLVVEKSNRAPLAQISSEIDRIKSTTTLSSFKIITEIANEASKDYKGSNYDYLLGKALELARSRREQIINSIVVQIQMNIDTATTTGELYNVLDITDGNKTLTDWGLTTEKSTDLYTVFTHLDRLIATTIEKSDFFIDNFARYEITSKLTLIINEKARSLLIH